MPRITPRISAMIATISAFSASCLRSSSAAAAVCGVAANGNAIFGLIINDANYNEMPKNKGRLNIGGGGHTSANLGEPKPVLASQLGAALNPCAQQGKLSTRHLLSPVTMSLNASGCEAAIMYKSG